MLPKLSGIHAFLWTATLLLLPIIPVIAQDNPISNFTVQGTAQCGETTISWQGGTPPYNLDVDSTGYITNVSIPNGVSYRLRDTNLTFRLFYSAGETVSVQVRELNGDIFSEHPSVQFTVTQGATDACLILARDQAQSGSLTLTQPQVVPQCSPFSINWSGDADSMGYVIPDDQFTVFFLLKTKPSSLFSYADYTDKKMIATSPYSITWNVDSSLRNHSTVFYLPYPVGTVLSVSAGTVPSPNFESNVTIAADRGNSHCLLADFNSPSSSIESTLGIPTSLESSMSTSAEISSPTSSNISPDQGTSINPGGADAHASPSPVASIAGGVVGGCVALALIMIGVWFAYKRRGRSTDKGVELESVFVAQPFTLQSPTNSSIGATFGKGSSRPHPDQTVQSVSAADISPQTLRTEGSLPLSQQRDNDPLGNQPAGGQEQIAGGNDMENRMREMQSHVNMLIRELTRMHMSPPPSYASSDHGGDVVN